VHVSRIEDQRFDPDGPRLVGAELRCRHGSTPPERLIKGGLPPEAMVASVLAAKYASHLPLYRQAQMLAAQGLDIKRAVRAFWVGYAATELKPLSHRLRELILASGKIAVDETIAPVLDPAGTGSRASWMTAASSSTPISSSAASAPLCSIARMHSSPATRERRTGPASLRC
jgi:hypothetical protein